MLVTSDDVIGPVEPLGKVRLPGAFQPKDRQYRREVAKRLAKTSLRQAGRRHRERSRSEVHPVELDPELRFRLRAAAQAERYERELAEIADRVEGHNRSLSREFDRVVAVLEHRGYLLRPDSGWSLTDKGTMLASVFHECDLLITECVGLGLLDDVEAPELAGLISVFVHEHRSPEPPAPPWFPDAAARQRWLRILAVERGLVRRGTGEWLGRPPASGPGLLRRRPRMGGRAPADHRRR